jgi:hypothetical protein
VSRKPFNPRFTNECTEKSASTPLRVRNDAYSTSTYDVIARKKFVRRRLPVTRCTSRPCSSAAFDSHGISEPFSTGSQPQ